MPPLGWLPPEQYFLSTWYVSKESFSIPSVYRCFPGAVVKMLALKGEKQDASLCKWPFSGEIMLFPKVRVHCCWATAKSSFPTPSGGDNNAHVCHFLISVEIAGLIFTAEKKKLIWKINAHPPRRLHLPDCFTSMSSASAHLPLHCQGCVLPSNDSAPLVPVGGDGSQCGSGSGMSHSPWGWCPPRALSISVGISRELFLV